MVNGKYTCTYHLPLTIYPSHLCHFYLISLLAQVGWKGASLARMAAAGLLAPAGFHITTAAYHYFVTTHGLQAQILTAVAAVNGAQGTMEVLQAANTGLEMVHG